MSWLWPFAVGQAGEAPNGLKFVGTPEATKTNRVSPAAPDRPFAVLSSLVLPVCAVPQAVTPRPRAARRGPAR